MWKRTRMRCRSGGICRPPRVTRRRALVLTSVRGVACCSGGVVNKIRNINTRGGVGQWNVFAAHCPSEVLAYCFGGLPLRLGTAIPGVASELSPSEPYIHRTEALISVTLQRCKRSRVFGWPPRCPYMGRCPQGWHPWGAEARSGCGWRPFTADGSATGGGGGGIVERGSRLHSRWWRWRCSRLDQCCLIHSRCSTQQSGMQGRRHQRPGPFASTLQGR